jgi:hypothetical protein
MKYHKLAEQFSALFAMPSVDHFTPVKEAMSCAIEFLRQHDEDPDEVVADLDLENPDVGIPYVLKVLRTDPKPERKNAAYLLQRCLHVIEDKRVTELDRRAIPLLLAGMSTYVSDQASRAARARRPTRSEGDALDRGLNDLGKRKLKATWKDVLSQLEEEGVVTVWSDATVTFTDGATETTIARKTFQTRLRKAQERSANKKSRVAR